MASYQLEKDTYQFALDLHKRKIKVAVITGAEYQLDKNIASSGKIDITKIYAPLRRKLLSFGQIGSKHKTTSIGCCAEVAASNPIYHNNSNQFLTDIELSTAYRPRTMQVKSKCHICTDIFIKKCLTAS